MAGPEAPTALGPVDRTGRLAGLKRGLWWTGRLLGAAFLASVAGAIPILLELHVSGWLTGEIRIRSAGDAIGQLVMVVGFGAPFAAVMDGLPPAFAVGLVLLAAAIRNERARHEAIWAIAGAAVALFAVSSSFIERADILAWAIAAMSGAAGGLLLRRLLSPGGRFDEAVHRPEKPGSLERWGYALLSGIWPVGVLALAYSLEGGAADWFILAIDALLLVAVGLIVIGRRRRRRMAGEAALRPA